MAKLKVFRTPIGFHDAYVAAPSQRAALDAWGASANLFARGVAEVVTDPKLTAAPLARPGEVIKVPRGTSAEHLAALPKGARAGKAKAVRAAKSPPAARPSRATLDAADAALSALEKRQRDDRRAIERRAAALAKERAALETSQRAERKRLEDERDAAAAAYDRALQRWRG